MEKGEKLFKRSLLQSPWTLLTVGLRAISTISVMKIVAVYFGSAGLAIFSHFQNLVALVTQIPDQGTNLAVIGSYAEFDERKRRKLLGTAFLINLGIFVIIIILLIFSREFFLKYFQFFLQTPIYFWLLIASVFFVLLNSLAFSFLYARQAFKLLFGITFANVLIIVASVYSGALSGDVQKALLAFALGWAAYSLVNFLFLYIRRELPSMNLSFDKSVWKRVNSFVLIAIIGVLMGKWVDFFVRDFALDWFGLDTTGFWQAQVRMSESYRSVFMGTIGVIFYSQISRIERGGVLWAKYIRRMLFLAMGIALIGLILVWLFRTQLILLLFQEDLLPAADFIQYQLLGDLFAMPSFLLVFMIIADKKWKTYAILHILSALVYLLAMAFLLGLTNTGIEGIPIANGIRFFLFLCTLLLIYRKDLGK